MELLKQRGSFLPPGVFQLEVAGKWKKGNLRAVITKGRSRSAWELESSECELHCRPDDAAASPGKGNCAKRYGKQGSVIGIRRMAFQSGRWPFPADLARV